MRINFFLIYCGLFVLILVKKTKNKKKTYQDEDKKSAINKKKNSQIKKPHLKMIQIKDNPLLFLQLMMSSFKVLMLVH